jgi:tetratricopeptide (TPR) repeat protein
MFRRLLRALGSKANDSPRKDSTTASPVGSFDHYTDAVDTIKRLKREQRHDEAESLLLWCIEQTEQEEFDDPAPWYYKNLAIVYRKENRYDDEVQIIKRYLNNAPSPRDDLQKRLDRAEELAENNES